MQLPGKPNSKITDINHFLHFSQSFLQTFSHFKGNEFSQGVLVLPQRFSDLSDYFSTFGCRYLSPLMEGSCCFVDHGIIAFPVGRCYSRNFFSIYGGIRLNQ